MINFSDNIEFDQNHTSVRLTLDKKVYSREAILRACYWFSRDLSFNVQDHEDFVNVTVQLRITTPTLAQPKVGKIDDFVPELLNAFVDAQLREEIRAETATVRELIIAKAFAEAGILEDSPPGTFDDPVARSKEEPQNLVNIRTDVSES